MLSPDVESIFINDPVFGKKFSIVKKELELKGHGGRGRVHPDLIPFPGKPDKVLMVYTPENPNFYENMCLVSSPRNDLINWSDELWDNPVIRVDTNVKWKDYHLADFCLLFVSELKQKWWTWFQPQSQSFGCQIALGLSSDGISWIDNIEGNPVMCSRDDGNVWEYDYLRAPSVLWNRNRQKFEMFYDNLQSDWSKPIRLCRAESRDGKRWLKRRIMYDPENHSEKTHAFHPVVRYFAGHYWCWFPRYRKGLWLMYSKTGLPGQWSRPFPVLTPDKIGAKAMYRAGVLIDSNYKIHMMISAIHKNNIFKIHYLISELSRTGKKQLLNKNYSINDFDFGGSIITR